MNSKTLMLLPFLFEAGFAYSRSLIVEKPKEISTTPKIAVLTIGVKDFSDPYWQDLHYPIDDARSIDAAVGVETGLQKFSVALSGKSARRQDVLRTLSELEAALTSKDVLVVYISSHGTLAIDGSTLEPVVVLQDTDHNQLLETGLSHRKLYAAIDRISAKRKLVIFASCYSGTGKSKLSDKVESILGRAKGRMIPDLEDVSEGTMIFSAASKGEPAAEDSRLKGDIYTKFLLEGLEHGDRNQDGTVSALEAHDYAKQKTYDYTGGRQRPTMRIDAVGESDFSLRGVPKSPRNPVLRAYDKRFDGLSLSINQKSKGELPSAFPLSPGRNVIKIFGPGSQVPISEYAVDVSGDEVLDLDTLFAMAPYRFALNFGSHAWLDQSAGQLAGSTDLGLRYGLEFVHRLGDFGYGVGATQLHHYRAELRPGVEVDTDFLSFDLDFRYQQRIVRGLLVSGGPFVSYVWMDLKFKDQEDSQVSTASDSTLGFGAFAEVGYEFGFGLGLSGKVKYQKLNFDFGSYGDVDATNVSLDMNVSYAFGARARRVK